MFADDSTTVSMLEIINAVLTDAGDEPIDRILRMNSQYDLIAENIGKKNGRLDVRAESSDGELFDIEVQLRTIGSMNDRSWFYGSRLMSESFGEGEPYDQVPRVRVINLLDLVLRTEHDDFLQPIGVMYKKEPAIASDAFRIYNIELPKFRAAYKTLESVKHDPLLRWLYLFEEAYKNEQEMEVLMDMSEGLRVFADKYNRSISDPNLRRLYELDQSARRDERAIVRTAEMAQRTRFIKHMLGKGLPVDLIYDCVDVPHAEVDAIIAKLRVNARP